MLAIATFGYASERKVFIERRPVQAKRRKLNLIELGIGGCFQAWIPIHGESELASTLQTHGHESIQVNGADWLVNQSVHAIFG